MSKHVYICGDSFGVSDPEYGACWSDMIADQYQTTNLSRVCASNLLISQQVDQAIKQRPDFIICLCTSSTRQNVRFGKEIVPYSIHSIDRTPEFDQRQKDVLKQYVAEFFDLDIAIYESQCLIEHTLYKLERSQIPYLFDQGGYEHGIRKQYFQQYTHRRSQYNLWDYAEKRELRPYYHITDIGIHKQVAEYYINVIG
jgi:hypothetical protein